MTEAIELSIRNKIKDSMEKYANIGPDKMEGLLPNLGLTGKLYEASVLAEVCTQLNKKEGITFQLSQGTALQFRQKGGPINRRFPHLKLFKSGRVVAELHLDIYFKTLSASHRLATKLEPGDFHELDIAIVAPNITGYPNVHEVFLAIECKQTTLEKHIIREILGYRRELALFVDPQDTIFSTWPMSKVQASPPSVQMFYCSDKDVIKYKDNCKIFGIELVHFRM